MSQVLVCDDEVKLARLLGTALESAGHGVTRAAGVKEAAHRMEERSFDLVITDLRLLDGDGLSVVRAAKQHGCDAMVITAHATTETAIEAMRLGAHDYLIKPFSLDEFRIKVAQMLSRRALQEQNQRLLHQLRTYRSTERLVGSSARMREVFEQILQVAPSNATVLLTGESGTGKTVLARYLHEHSRRAGGPLGELHCAALPEALLDAELFGHERGAFTGAVGERAGHLERAHRGTLFLDEIGEIPLNIQVKLLRFLQDRTFFRIGSTQAKTIDVRFVVATNRNLTEAVQQRAFREDLFYRINVFPIVVPPLREHADDIPALAAGFLQQRSAGLKLSDEALDALLRYQWPGNVRELENVLERALIIAGVAGGSDQKEERLIELRHLPQTLREQLPAIPTSHLLRPGFSIDRLERELVRESLARSSGNKSEAARLLGITRRRLYSRLKSIESAEQEISAGGAAQGPSEDARPGTASSEHGAQNSEDGEDDPSS